MSHDGVAFELAGLACTGADCFVAAGVVIRTSANENDVWIGAGESFGYECLASPFTGGFNGIGAGPGGMWMLAGSSGFLELR